MKKVYWGELFKYPANKFNGRWLINMLSVRNTYTLFITKRCFCYLMFCASHCIDEEKQSFESQVTFNDSGLYFYRLEAGGYRDLKKLILIK